MTHRETPATDTREKPKELRRPIETVARLHSASDGGIFLTFWTNGDLPDLPTGRDYRIRISPP